MCCHLWELCPRIYYWFTYIHSFKLEANDKAPEFFGQNFLKIFSIFPIFFQYSLSKFWPGRNFKFFGGVRSEATRGEASPPPKNFKFRTQPQCARKSEIWGFIRSWLQGSFFKKAQDIYWKSPVHLLIFF